MAEKDWEGERKLQWLAALKSFLQKHFPETTVTLQPRHQTAFIYSIDGAHGVASLAISPEALTTLVRSSRPVDPDVFSKIDQEYDLFAKSSPMITGEMATQLSH